jgi:hypothetical protein
MRRSERFPSRFVQASDLKPGGVTVTIDRVDMVEIGQGRDKKEKPVVQFKNASKGLVLNRTNDEVITDLFGDDDRDWRGQKIVLFPTTTPFGGKVVDCIRVRAVDGATTTAAAEEESENPAPPEPKKSKWPDGDVPPDFDDEIPF